MIVLNDAHTVREILDKRSSSSSDRAPSYICTEVSFAAPASSRPSELDLTSRLIPQLIARNNHILLANGPRSALFRRLWNITISPINVSRHAPLQNAEGIAVLHNLIQDPTGFYEGWFLLHMVPALTPTRATWI